MQFFIALKSRFSPLLLTLETNNQCDYVYCTAFMLLVMFQVSNTGLQTTIGIFKAYKYDEHQMVK